MLKLKASLNIRANVDGTKLALEIKMNNPKIKYKTTITGTKLEVTLTIDLSPPKITYEVRIVKIIPIKSFQLPLPISMRALGFRTSIYD